MNAHRPTHRLHGAIGSFLMGFVVGSLLAGALWIANNQIVSAAAPWAQAMRGWSEGLTTTFFPLGILLLNPNAQRHMLALLLLINGFAFGLIGIAAWRLAKGRRGTVALAIVLVIMALLLNNAWVLVAIGVAVDTGVKDAAATVTLIHWPSFAIVAGAIVLTLRTLLRHRSRDLRQT